MKGAFMRKIRFYLGIGISNAAQEEVVEFEDDTTDDEIEDAFQEWKSNYIDANWWDEE
jgi:hypothetical protein